MTKKILSVRATKSVNPLHSSVDSTLTQTHLLSDTQSSLGETSIERRKILITGCSSGIGYYCAKRLHQDGHLVVAACRKLVDVRRLISEGLYAVQIDLDDSTSIKEGIIDALAITQGELDVLINNAAYGQPGAVEDLSRQALEKQFSTNVFGTHELTTKLIKTLLVSHNPRIIQISSVLGLVAMHYRGAYIASKFALEGLTDTLRLELSDTKVKVVLIEPGPITSAFRDNAHKALLENVDINKSRHIDNYKFAIKRLSGDKKQPFTLSEEAVYKKVKQAIISSSPKPRYYVTFPTYLFGTLRRIFSTRLLDKILSRAIDK